MPRKTSTARKSTAPNTPKASTAKKTTTAKKGATVKAPRRSGSIFTSPRDGQLARDLRPTEIRYNDRTGKYDVFLSGKKVASCASMSSARRARYRAEKEQGFKLTARQLAKLQAS